MLNLPNLATRGEAGEKGEICKMANSEVERVWNPETGLWEVVEEPPEKEETSGDVPPSRERDDGQASRVSGNCNRGNRGSRRRGGHR